MYVVEENVSVDVGEDEIERVGLEELVKVVSATAVSLNVVGVVEKDVFGSVFEGPFVDVDGIDRGGSFFCGEDGEDGGSATHVEKRFPCHIAGKYESYHE